ncbi:MAG: hypothetical protein FWB72_01550 [Firmicutes bacterium]|nr:hypothetical protein [Bacillota bacterium]
MFKAFYFFTGEIKQIYRQCILFLVTSALVFSLALGVFSFTYSYRYNYGNMLDEVHPAGREFLISVPSASALRSASGVVDKLSVFGDNITTEMSLSFAHTTLEVGQGVRDIVTNTTIGGGIAYYFRGTLPYAFSNARFIAGRSWNAGDNVRQGSAYSIFISIEVANYLRTSVGKTITHSYNNTQFIVRGIYYRGAVSRECLLGYIPFFVMPAQFVLNAVPASNFDSLNFVAEVANTSRMVDAYFQLARLGITNLDSYYFFENLRTTRAVEILMLTLSFLVIIVALLILFNSLKIVLNVRAEFIARLKLLGARSYLITLIYYIVFYAIFLLAFGLSILLSTLTLTRYESVAETLFDFPFVITLNFPLILAMFVASSVLIFASYFLFLRRIGKVNPLDLMKED